MLDAGCTVKCFGGDEQAFALALQVTPCLQANCSRECLVP
jgi:hypothetical protein